MLAFTATGFQLGRDRFGVALGTTCARFEKSGRLCLLWARNSHEVADFFRRVETPGLANDDMRTFVAMLRRVLSEAAGHAVDDSRLWAFLSHFFVLTFDFEQGDESASLAAAVDRLRSALTRADSGRAQELWQALADIADRTKPTAGSLDRALLIERLRHKFRLVPRHDLQPELERIRDASQRALDDIRTEIGGAHLPRSGLDEELRNALDASQLVEAAESPADESMRNIEAMDDLCRAVIETTDRLTVSCLRGNAGAGGAFLALAVDRVWAAEGVVLNPHYKGMGNLYGSEYWTYLLPRRIGEARARAIMQGRLPIGARQALDPMF